MIKEILWIILALAVGTASAYCMFDSMARLEELDQKQKLEKAKAGQHVTYNGMGFLKISGGER